MILFLLIVDILDLTDSGKTKDFIKNTNPDWIINCAGI
jgi:dTDP-4-dehydrorhamnose reductase